MADIIGAKIVGVRSLTDAELDREGWLDQAHPDQVARQDRCVRRGSRSAITARNRHGAEALTAKSALSRAVHSLS